MGPPMLHDQNDTRRDETLPPKGCSSSIETHKTPPSPTRFD